MTTDEFKKAGFAYNMQVIFNGEKYSVGEVDFDQSLIGLSGYYSNDYDLIKWVRCENIESMDIGKEQP